ncbi:MAG: hypothetical protein Q9186_005114 [Xanthomendoza sp. 1 TL-2023]
MVLVRKRVWFCHKETQQKHFVQQQKYDVHFSCSSIEINPPLAPLTRQTTKGPLDEDDPLASAHSPEPQPPTTSTPSAPSTTEAASIPIPPTPSTTTTSNPLSPSKPLAVRPRSRSPLPPSKKDLSFLLRQSNFHRISQTDISPPFRSTPAASDTPLPALLRQGHYYRAALFAVGELIASSAELTPKEIFELLYTRLACLTLITQTPLAGKESLVLGDIHSPFYLEEESGKCILPWELRVLAVRLQALGAGDARRGVQGYYDLAAYARGQLKGMRGNGDDDAKILWQGRLKDLGIRIGNALVELPDLEAGRRHFESLADATIAEDERLTLQGWVAMLCLRMGDLASAKSWIGEDNQELNDAIKLDPTQPQKGEKQEVLKALLAMAEGEYENAVTAWRSLLDGPDDILARQNLAVCLLYTGRLSQTSQILHHLLTQKTHIPHALTFNLATIYELSSDKSRERKIELAEKVARKLRSGYDDDLGGIKEGGGGGGGKRMERGNGEFKL